MAKTNDWVATLLTNGDDISMQDIIANGITPDNTSIQSEDYYKGIDQVREKFTDEKGKFDESKFDNFYKSALSTYNDYANGSFEQDLIKQMAKDPFDWTEPLNTNRTNYTASIQVGYNPDRRSMGIGNLFEVGGPSFSMREVAQANIARDENDNLLGWTPNEKGGLFKSITRPTLALATWDEDGTHEINGVLVTHKKGEYKLDEFGDPYYEKLGKREGYDKDILRWTDTITVDGSILNKIDIFDSDGLTKSAAKTIAKSIAIMTPLLIPGVGKVYGATKAFFDLVSVMPTLGKAINGLITNDNTNEFGTALTQAENYVTRYTGTTSDYSREKFFSLENIGNIFTDSAGQLFSQRQVGNLAKALNLGGDALRTSKIGQNLSLGYMALTSSRESYAEFKRAGASDAAAGAGMLGITAALFGLMSQDYFRDFAFQDTYLTQSEAREALKQFERVTREELVPELVSKEIKEAALKATDKVGLAKLWESVKNGTTNIAKKVFSKPEVRNVLSQMWYGSINEATEEVIEEVATDAVKGAFSFLDAIGVPMTNRKDENLDFGITAEDMFQRYATSFLGGFLGGATFQGYELIENRHIPYLDWKKTPEDVRKHIAYLITTGHDKELFNIAKARFDKGRMGNKNLSAKDGRWVTDINGVQKFIWNQGTELDNQNTAVYNRLFGDLVQYKRMIQDGILFNTDTFNPLTKTGDLFKLTESFIKEAEDQNISVDELLLRKGSNPIIQYIFDSGLDTSTITDDIVELNSKIIEANLKIKSLEKDNPDDADKDALKRAKDELKNLFEERAELISGNKNHLYAEQILFTVHPHLHSLLFSKSSGDKTPFIASNVNNYVQIKYNKKWEDLSEIEKDSYKKEYNAYMASKGGDQIKKAFKAFSQFNKLSAPIFTEFDNKYKDAKQNSFYIDEKTFSRKSNLNVWEENKIELSKYNLALQNVDKKIADRIAALNDTSKIAEDTELLNLQDQKNEIIGEMNFIQSNIANLELHISEILESAPNEIGLDSYIDPILSIVDSENVTLDNLYETLEGVQTYYDKLKEENVISDNDVVLNRVLQAFESGLNNDSSNAFRRTNQYNTLFNTALNFLDDEDAFDIAGSITNTFFLEFGTVEAALKDYYSKLGTGKISELANIRNNIAEAINKRVEKLKETSIGKNLVDKSEEFKNWINDLPELLLFGSIDNKPDLRLPTALEKLNAAKQSLLPTPVLDLLKSFNLNVDENTINALQLLEEEKTNLVLSKTPSEYMISDQFKVQALYQLLDLLNLLEAEAEVATDGYNNAINSFKLSKDDFVAEITEESASILLEDISFLRKKIKSLLNLAEANTADKVKIQKDIEINCYPKYLTSLFEGEDLPDDAEESVREATFTKQLAKLIGLTNKSLKDLWNETLTELELTSLDYNKITDDNFSSFRKAAHVFENKLRIIASNNGKIDEDFGKRLVEISGEDTWKMKQTLLSRDPDYKVTSYQRMMYLASVFAYDANNFYQKYLNAINNSPFCPFYNQELVIRQVWGAISNKQLYKGIVNRLREQVNKIADNDEYLKGIKAAINTIFVDGGTGTGKSTAIASTIVNMLDHNRIIVTAPTEKLLDPETGSVGKLVQDSKKRMLTENLLRQMYDDFDELERNEESKDHKNQFNQDVLNSKVKDISSLFGDNIKLEDEKVIIIDEGSLLDEGYIQALTTAAEKNNIIIIFLGDIKQNSALKEGIPNGYFDFIGLLTTSLSETVRAGNKAKVDNYRAVNVPLASVVEFTKEDTKNNSPNEASKELKRYINENGLIGLNYYYKPNLKFCGEKIVSSSDNAKSMLDEILSYPEDKTIAVITDDTTDEWWQKQTLPKNVERINYKVVQGGEYDYAIIDHDFGKFNGNQEYLILRDLYTLINRSREGSIIVDSHNALNNLIENKEDNGGNREIKLNDSIIDSFKTWKTDIINNIGIQQTKEEKKLELEDPNVKVDDFEGTDLNDDSFKSLEVKGSTVITGGALKPLTESEKEEILNGPGAIQNRKRRTQEENSIDYDAFGDWCDNELINYEQSSVVSFFKNYFTDSNRPSENSWTFFVKYISSIIIDNIHNLKSYNFGENYKLNQLYADFIKKWDSESSHTYYLNKISDDAGVLLYAFNNMLIPIAIVNNVKRANSYTKFEVDSKSNPFTRTYGMGFFSKSKESKSSKKGYVNAPTRNYITNACKHLYWDSTFGIFSLEEGKSNIPDKYHLIDKDNKDKTALYEKKTRGKTEAMFTHNLYYSIHEIPNSFKYSKDEDGLNTYYTRGNTTANTETDMCALRTIQHSISLQELFEICDVMQYALGNNQKNKLHGISENLNISNREDALAWVASKLGSMDELRLPSTSDEKQRREFIKNNFKLLSSKYEVINKNMVKKLISNIYAIFSTNPDFDKDQFVQRLFNYLGYLPELDNNRLLQYGYQITVKDKSEENRHYYFELNSDRNYTLSTYNFKPEEQVAIINNAGKVDKLPEIFDKIKEHLGDDFPDVDNITDAIFKGDLSFTLIKHITRPTETDAEHRYYQMNAYDLIFKLLNIKDLDINKLGEELLKTKAFSSGIYARDASNMYFDNDDTVSAFKQFYPDGDLVKQYSSDFGVGLAPVYQFSMNNASNIDDNPETDLDKLIVNSGILQKEVETVNTITSISKSGETIIFNDNAFVTSDGEKLTVLGVENNELVLSSNDKLFKISKDPFIDIESLKDDLNKNIVGYTTDNSPIYNTGEGQYLYKNQYFKLSDISKKMEEGSIMKFQINRSIITIPNNTPLANNIRTYFNSSIHPTIRINAGTTASKKDNIFTFTYPITVNKDWIKQISPEFNKEGSSFNIIGLDFNKNLIIFADNTTHEVPNMNNLPTSAFKELSTLLDNPITNNFNRISVKNSLDIMLNSTASAYDTDLLLNNIDDLFDNIESFDDTLKVINDFLAKNNQPYELGYDEVSNEFYLKDNSSDINIVLEAIGWNWTDTYNEISDIPFEDLTLDTDKQSNVVRYLVDNRYLVLKGNGSIRVIKDNKDLWNEINKYLSNTSNDLEVKVTTWIRAELSNSYNKEDYKNQVKAIDKEIWRTVGKLLRDWKAFINQNPVDPGC